MPDAVTHRVDDALVDMHNTLRTVEFRLALSRITERYPPDTVAGRLAADALAKYPNPFENADRENDCEPFPIPEIEGLPLGPAALEVAGVAELREALDYLEAEARRFAGFYPDASDGRNTFVIFADKIATLTNQRKAPFND